METLLMQIQSFLIVLLMGIGVLKRKVIKTHVLIMSLAIAWDVILILQIEFSRSAILKASQAVKNSLALNIHVSIAVLTVVMYGFMIHSGRKMLGFRKIKNLNYPHLKKRHKLLGVFTISLRILTFITSFWAVHPQ